MMDLSADSGLTVVAYTAEAGSKSAEALDLLASWTVTINQAETAETAERAKRAALRIAVASRERQQRVVALPRRPDRRGNRSQP